MYPNLLLRPRPPPVQQGVTSRTPGCKSVCPPVGNHTQQPCPVTLASHFQTVNHPPLINYPIPVALREVAEYLASQNPDVDVETVTLAQHFPRYAPVLASSSSTSINVCTGRKTFTRADFSKSLRDLGLTPSAVSYPTTCRNIPR